MTHWRPVDSITSSPLVLEISPIKLVIATSAAKIRRMGEAGQRWCLLVLLVPCRASCIQGRQIPRQRGSSNAGAIPRCNTRRCRVLPASPPSSSPVTLHTDRALQKPTPLRSCWVEQQISDSEGTCLPPQLRGAPARWLSVSLDNAYPACLPAFVLACIVRLVRELI